jgi:hypothetical protein
MGTGQRRTRMTAAARMIDCRTGKKLSAGDDEDGGPKSPTAR